MSRKGKLTLERKLSLTGWAFLLPATLLILIFSFYPMVQAILLSLKAGRGAQAHYALTNFTRLLQDQTFRQDHISLLLQDHRQPKQITIKPFGSFHIRYYDQDIFQFHTKTSFPGRYHHFSIISFRKI